MNFSIVAGVVLYSRRMLCWLLVGTLNSNSKVLLTSYVFGRTALMIGCAGS
jgi:hypothetical protein